LPRLLRLLPGLQSKPDWRHALRRFFSENLRILADINELTQLLANS